MAWTTPKTWAGSELLTASDLNQYVRDNLSVLYDLAQGGGRKNLIDNGAMQVHQRGTSYTGDTTGNYRTADRWLTIISSCGTWTNSVENDAPTGSGFRKSFKMYCSNNSGALDAASDYADVRQYIEGQNLQAIKKGTANAEQLTLSFWTKSNKTGTYVVELRDDDNTRHVCATYSVVQSGTWEQQTITFPADATGAFDNDANASFTLRFILAAGTSFTSGTLATTWATPVDANRAVGQANLAAANANYWQVTGVQLQIGDAATEYAHRDYGTELAECQRYCYVYSVAGGSVGVFYGCYSDTDLIPYRLQGFNTSAFRLPGAGQTITGVGTQGTDFGVMQAGAGQTGFTFTCSGGVVSATKTGHGLTAHVSGLFGTWVVSADL